jgi:hypothetical protein
MMWVRAGYIDREFPKAVATGLAQPVLPRSSIEHGKARFGAVARSEPTLRPATPKPGAAGAWNGYTIEQFGHAHHMQPVIDELERTLRSFVSFMDDKVRLRERTPCPHLFDATDDNGL